MINIVWINHTNQSLKGFYRVCLYYNVYKPLTFIILFVFIKVNINLYVLKVKSKLVKNKLLQPKQNRATQRSVSLTSSCCRLPTFLQRRLCKTNVQTMFKSYPRCKRDGFRKRFRPVGKVPCLSWTRPWCIRICTQAPWCLQLCKIAGRSLAERKAGWQVFHKWLAWLVLDGFIFNFNRQVKSFIFELKTKVWRTFLSLRGYSCFYP